ncbi:MAG: family 10 glycosylhydrolase [Chitinophagaceae bacterium]|nr:family 10 glycosylhydrolase [Chitinophagaceae bacterium]
MTYFQIGAGTACPLTNMHLTAFAPRWLTAACCLLLSVCAVAQPQPKPHPTDAALRRLERQYLHTPVQQLPQPNGDVYLQRDFTAYLQEAASRQADGIAIEDDDHGHDHQGEALLAFLNRPHPSVATLQRYFAQAATEFGVPLPILQAYAQVQSNWAQVGPSMYGSWGMMGLVEQGEVKQLSEAAGLLGISTEAIKNEARQSIRAAAALLAHYQPAGSSHSRLADWFGAVARLTGLTDAGMRYSLAQRVYSTLQQGSKTISVWGEIIWLPPVATGSVPPQPVPTGPQPLGNGTPDYSAAIYNLTTCNFNSRPVGASPRYYFVHYIATGTYEGAISWFKNCSSQVSAHYVVRNADGQITQVVDEANRAWSQGVTEYNDRGIGVEHEVLATNLSMWDSQPMLTEAGKLCADVCNRNSIPKLRRSANGDAGIYGHSDVRATDCPNMTASRWDNFLANVAGALPSVAMPTLYSVLSTSGSTTLTASWKPNLESNLLGYRLYYATTDDLSSWALAANEQTLTAGTTSISLQPAQFVVPPAEAAYHFRLTAVVSNGALPPVESPASDVYSRSWGTTGPKVLVVDGFDRTSGSYKNASHNFAARYMRALRDRAVLEISCAANERIEDGSINLQQYAMVVWFVGDESSANVVLSTAEKNALRSYLSQGGKLFISGSEIAYNIGRSASTAYDLDFMANYLRATYAGDGASNYSPATGVATSPFAGISIPFGSIYPEDFPDNIGANNGSTSIFDYAITNTRGGVAYQGLFGGGTTAGAITYIGFPLETATDADMGLFMSKLLPYFGFSLLSAPPIAVNDAATVATGTIKRLHVLQNDLPNGSTINLASVQIVSAPANGTAQPHPDGTLRYHPTAGFTGIDAFTYKVASTDGYFSNTATVNLTVQPVAACEATPPEKDDRYPLRDMRGAWISTVSNLDWPSARTLSTTQQQAELITLLDSLKASGINSVFLQVRPECDALYQSAIEPWSYWLTNAQGTAPSPLWDPLAFAVAAAHQRGMDLHAWLNPYRAKQSTPTLAPGHVAVQHPEWVFTSGTLTMLNPGLPAVRQHITQVVADIATRYDVDGIHFDDYFYPYGGMQSQDLATFAAHNPLGLPDTASWRRYNVNTLIAQVYDTLQSINQALQKNVVFGVSPFGIWKSGTPAGITGSSSFSLFYCDPIAWLQAGKVDYLAPQLYWRITGPQDYNALSKWWQDRGQEYGRHIYAGQGLYRLSDASNWPASEILAQIDLNRDNQRPQLLGNILFRAAQLRSDTKGIKTALRNGPFQYPAYAPAFAWKDAVCPQAPTAVHFDGDTLRWTAPLPAADGDTAEKYVIYRYDDVLDLTPMQQDGRRVVAIVSSNRLYLPQAGPWLYAVAALDDNNNESSSTLASASAIQLCPGGSTSLPAQVGGSSWQWQQWVANSWQPLGTNAVFAGTQTATLQLTNVPANLYGLQLRCVANGNAAGPVYTLSFANTWQGTNAQWHQPANWSCGTLPTASTDVIIPGHLTVFPLVDAPGAAARSVLLRYGATLQVAPGIQLQLGSQ